MVGLAALFLACGSKSSSPPSRAPGQSAPTTSAPGEAQRSAKTPRAPGTHAVPTSPLLPVTADEPSWGPPLAPLTLVVFTAFECAACAELDRELRALRSRYGAELRVVYKFLPRADVADAGRAAAAALAAFRLGGGEVFTRYVELLHQHARALSDETLFELAEEVGLELESFRDALEDDQTRRKLASDERWARALGETRAPVLRINGLRVDAAAPERWVAVVEAELRAVAELRARGVAPAALYAERVRAHTRARRLRAPAAAAPSAPERIAVPIAASPRRGAPDALVTVVVFSEYECPYCKRLETSLAELLVRYPNELRVVFKHHPLPGHAHAWDAALLALEARAQGGDAAFWRAHAALFESSPDLGPARLLDVARELGLNPDAVARALREQRHAPAIAADLEHAAAADVTKTPTLLINGKKLVGAAPLEVLVDVVETELKLARSLVGRGVPRAQVYETLLRSPR